jgi:hypothetical protein
MLLVAEFTGAFALATQLLSLKGALRHLREIQLRDNCCFYAKMVCYT